MLLLIRLTLQISIMPEIGHELHLKQMQIAKSKQLK